MRWIKSYISIVVPFLTLLRVIIGFTHLIISSFGMLLVIDIVYTVLFDMCDLAKDV